MKKLISIVLVFVLLLSVAVVPSFAETTESEYLYKDKFIEQYEIDESSGDELLSYSEIYYHHVVGNDLYSEVDWVLVFANTNHVMDATCWIVLGDSRVIVSDSTGYPFKFCYGVYDVKENKFFGVDNYIDYSKYNGLEEYVNTHLGELIGDADGDGELSVLDATFIQLAIAQLCEFSSQDYIGIYGCPIQYLSDFDRDGERTILDATAIQLKLAGLE